MYKVPAGETPYSKAKHLQVVEKYPAGTIALFWEAINARDRIDSALKDMAVVMNQQNRPLEAIEAIKSSNSANTSFKSLLRRRFLIHALQTNPEFRNLASRSKPNLTICAQTEAAFPF